VSFKTAYFFSLNIISYAPSVLKLLDEKSVMTDISWEHKAFGCKSFSFEMLPIVLLPALSPFLKPKADEISVKCHIPLVINGN
jgi:hypothetical protein